MDELFDDGVNVVFQLGGDGDNRGPVGGGAADEFEDGFVVVCCPFFSHQVDLVLKDDNVFQFHDLNGSKMFRCLGLRTGFIARDEE